MSNINNFVGKNGKILIVDDEPYNTRMLKLKFENAGYKVVTASNGFDGLSKFKMEYPDVVITDIKMPVMNGREMCQSLKESMKERRFLIIVMTSTTDTTERLWVNEINNVSLLEKPISPNHLLALVEDYLNEPA